MPQRLEKDELVDVVLDALATAGFKVQRDKEHPFYVLVDVPGRQEKLVIHIWNITHGGKSRAADEYRIQITGVDKLLFKEGYKTLLLGIARLDDIHPIVVAFDPDEHANFGSSPSIQVGEETLKAALDRGVAFEEKTLATGNAEMVIAFRPDLIPQYLSELYPQYHAPGTTTSKPEGEKVAGLNFTKPELTEEELTGFSEERKRALRTTAAWARDRNFRRKVLFVYNHACAMCGLQGTLVQGAHIVAVRQEGSTDDVRNGLALCSNHHTAYDRGLLAIDTGYVIRVNMEMIAELEKEGLAAGLKEFLAGSRVGEKILGPKEEKYWPDPARLAENLTAMKNQRGFEFS